MNEQEAVERIKSGICDENGTARYCHDNCMYGEDKCAYSMAIKALEEVKQYREIGTVEEFRKIKISNSLKKESEDEKKAVRWLKEILDNRVNLYYADEIARTLLNSFEALERYRAIGTVEECRAAVEKMKPKKTVSETVETRKCPICGSHDIFTYCGKCGQKMEW